MPRGTKPGERKGIAGRKKGVPNKKTQALIAAAEASGAMPLPTLLQIMRWHIAEFERLVAENPVDRDKVIETLELMRIAAKDAAPYLHATIKARIDIPLGDATALNEFANAKQALIALVDRVSATIVEGEDIKRIN